MKISAQGKTQLHDIDPNDPDFDLEAIYSISYDEEDQLLQVVFCS